MARLWVPCSHSLVGAPLELGGCRGRGQRFAGAQQCSDVDAVLGGLGRSGLWFGPQVVIAGVPLLDSRWRVIRRQAKTVENLSRHRQRGSSKGRILSQPCMKTAAFRQAPMAVSTDPFLMRQ